MTKTTKSDNTLTDDAKKDVLRVFKMWDIVSVPENEEVTIKFNGGGLLYVRVKKETVFK